jgi:hypothetical protein
MAKIASMKNREIEKCLNDYLSIRDPNQRYASYDYCYNYFRSFADSDQVTKLVSDENKQNSCLQLGFYLASWGMYRGSSQLLQKSAKGLEKVIEVLAATDSALFKIDVHKYDEESIQQILDLKDRLQEAFSHDATTTLLTKTMLGVFGCIPAFDSYFVRGSGLRTVNEENLLQIKDFYLRNEDLIERNRNSRFTLNFDSGEPTKHQYTRAKMIDMIFFVSGKPRAK